MPVVRRERGMWDGVGGACRVLAILLSGMIVAIAELGATAPEAAAEGPRAAATCRWELVEIGATAPARRY